MWKTFLEGMGSETVEWSSRSRPPARIAGRCTVFAESDMIHKQQTGYPTEGIILGPCGALVRNYLNNVDLGKQILPQVAVQGSVAFDPGIIRAFDETLHTEVYVPPHSELMGSIGAAPLVGEEMRNNNHKTTVKGFHVCQTDLRVSSFTCKACPNQCEITQLFVDGKVWAKCGGRCDL